MLHLTDRLMHILADHTGQEYEKVRRDSERDYFLSAEEAKAYGVIDEVFAGTTESLISLAGRRHGRGGARGRRCWEPEPKKKWWCAAIEKVNEGLFARQRGL